MTEFLTTGNKAKCCGCMGCVLKCPAGALSIQTDEEGFAYPSLDKTKCTGCGVCAKACDFTSPHTNAPIKAYGLKHKSDDVRMESSSGGAFTAISDFYLAQGFYVFGAVYDENLKVMHKGGKTTQIRNLMRKSKYVQSSLGTSFQDIAHLLAEGEKVLFSGTPCQVGGLNKYLKKDYENLVTIDFICHGVGSPKFFQDFLEYAGNRNKIYEFQFKDKQFLWTRQKSSIKCEDGTNSQDVCMFMKGYSRGFIKRPSCHCCTYCEPSRPSDFTICDFWGIEKVNSAFFDEKGVSMLFANTEKALASLDEITKSCKTFTLNTQDAIKLPYCMRKDYKPPRSYIRGKFWKYYLNHSPEQSLRLYCSDTTRSKLARKPAEYFNKYVLKKYK